MRKGCPAILPARDGDVLVSWVVENKLYDASCVFWTGYSDVIAGLGYGDRGGWHEWGCFAVVEKSLEFAFAGANAVGDTVDDNLDEREPVIT